jgi:20S proteasome alpha/beta subunit
VTLLVALKGKDGLVMAADSRGTFGDPRGVTAQNDEQQKAHILAPHVAVLAAGSGELGAMIIAETKQSVADSKIDGATAVLNLLRDTVRKRYDEWFPTVPAVQPASGDVAMRPDLAFVVGGYELGDESSQHLYSLGSFYDFPPMLHDYGFAVQGIAQYALYLLNRLYQSDRTIKELSALAVYTITETASQDGKVGGPVNVITIVPGDEGCQAMSADDVTDVQAANASRSSALRDSFYN